MVRSVRIESRVGKDGVLSLRVPLSAADADADVVVTIEPKPGQARVADKATWPPQYFEQTYGSLADEPMEIPGDAAPSPEGVE